MKNILISILFLLIAIAVFSEPDFRKINWGMNMAQVKKIETEKLEKETNDSLLYSTKVAGFKTLLLYVFAGNKLTRAGYIFITEHTNDNDYINDFKKVDELLIKKYGTPAEQETYWKNDLYKDTPSDWGTAIALGHLIYYTDWQTDKTYIEHGLSGDNYKITHRILYISQELKDYEEKMQEKASTDNL